MHISQWMDPKAGLHAEDTRQTRQTRGPQMSLRRIFGTIVEIVHYEKENEEERPHKSPPPKININDQDFPFQWRDVLETRTGGEGTHETRCREGDRTTLSKRGHSTLFSNISASYLRNEQKGKETHDSNKLSNLGGEIQ